MADAAQIRALTPNDYDSLLELWQASGLHSLRPDGRDSREAVTRQLSTGVQTILGLVINDHLAGAVVVTHDSRKGWINRLVVHPDFRERGHARKLIAAAEESLHAWGITVIAVLIERQNTASLALFRSAGYVESDPPVQYLSKRDSSRA